MKASNIISIISLGGLLVLASCKESSTTSGSGSGSSGYVLYSEKSLLPAGTVVTKTESEKMDEATVKMQMQGQDMSGSMSRAGESEEVRTFVSDTEITVEVKKDKAETIMTLNGQVMPGRPEIEPLSGKTVVLTHNGDVWSGKLKEGTANPSEVGAIDKMVNGMNTPDEKAIFGTEPRKVGDTWDVDPTKLSSFNEDADKMDGTFKVTFEKVEEYKGLECAVIVAEVDMKGKTEEGFEMQMKGKMTVRQSIKYCTAVSMDMQGTFSMNGDVGNGGTMQIEGPMIMKGDTTIKTP